MTVVSWSLSSIVFSSASSLYSVSAPVPSLVPPGVSLAPFVSSYSSFLPLVASFPSLLPVPPSSSLASVVPRDPRSSPGVSAGPGFSSALRGSGSAISHVTSNVDTGSSSVSLYFIAYLLFRGGDVASGAGDNESSSWVRPSSHRLFASGLFASGLFPAAKPSALMLSICRFGLQPSRRFASETHASSCLTWPSPLQSRERLI